MKISHLVLISLMLTALEASAQQNVNSIVADTTAKRLHIKTVTQLGYSDSGKTLISSTRENYNTDGRIIERIDSTNSSDADRDYQQPLKPWLHKFFFYNRDGRISKDSSVNYFIQVSQTTAFYSYNKKGQLIHQRSVYYIGKDMSSVLETYYYNKRGAVDHVTGKDKTAMYKYDSRGNLTEEKQLLPFRAFGIDNSTIIYIYDPTGRIISKTGYGKLKNGKKAILSETYLAYNNEEQMSIENSEQYLPLKSNTVVPPFKAEVTTLYDNRGLVIKNISNYTTFLGIKSQISLPSYNYAFYNYAFY